jgi:hypothetical protein
MGFTPRFSAVIVLNGPPALAINYSQKFLSPPPPIHTPTHQSSPLFALWCAAAARVGKVGFNG